MNQRSIALTIAVVLGGCTNGGALSGTGGGGGNAGCATDQREDGYGNCLHTCLDDTDCGDLAWCHEATGLCLPASTDVCEPASCLPGFGCPGDGTGECVPVAGYCESTLDCPIGDRCDAGRCVSAANDLVQTCTVDTECGLAMACRYGVCTGCLEDIQCTSWQSDAQCLMGTCVVTGGAASGCLVTGCDAGFRCNPVSGLCEASCTADEDCDTGEICAPVLGQCVTDPGCTLDDDCLGEQTCSTGLGFEDGLCTGCSDAEPCKEGLACFLGACLPELVQDPCAEVVCEVGELCDPATAACYPADGSCVDETDCRTGQSCNFIGFCSGCTTDNDCRAAQRCIFSTCVPTGG